ncbi:MAG: hypothetical protein WC869_05550 [Phycisphaerae bacterium]
MIFMVCIVSCQSISVAVPAEAAQDKGVPGAATTTRPSASKNRPPRPFVVKIHKAFEANVHSSGGIWLSAMYEPWKEYAEKWEKEPPSVPITVFLCRGSQDDVIGRFSLLMSQLVIYPFVKTSSNAPQPGELVWGNVDHPLVNRLRDIPRMAPSVDVYVVVHLLTLGSGGMRAMRGMLFEEVQWSVFAVVGGEYRGILWADDPNWPPWSQRLATLEAALKEQASDLGKALPVGWVSGPEKQPLSSKASEGKLFVVLLNPDVMKLSSDNVIVEPVELPARRGEITITVPDGKRIESGRTLLGKPLDVRTEGHVSHVTYQYSGGGEMLVFSLVKGDLSKVKQTASAGEDGDR